MSADINKIVESSGGDAPSPSCPSSSDFSTLNSLLQPGSSTNPTLPYVTSQGEIFLDSVMKSTLLSNGVRLLTCPGSAPFSSTIQNQFTSFISKFQIIAGLLNTLLDNLSKNNFESLTGRYAPIIGPLTIAKNQFAALSSSATFGAFNTQVSAKLKSINCTNFISILQITTPFITSISEVLNALQLANTGYNNLCSPPSTSKVSTHSGCGCPIKETFDNWETLIYPQAESHATTLLDLSNAFKQLKYGIASSVQSGPCVASILCFIAPQYSSLSSIINKLISMKTSVLQPFIDGIAKIQSDPTDFCYIDILLILNDVNDEINKTNTDIANLPTTLGNNPYWVDAFNAISKVSSSFDALFIKIITAVGLYFNSDHCANVNDPIPSEEDANTCPSNSDFSTLNSLLQPGSSTNQTLGYIVSEGRAFHDSLLALPKKQGGAYVMPCHYFGQPKHACDQTITSHYLQFKSGLLSKASSLNTLLDNLSQNNFGTLTGKYAPIIPLLAFAKNQFAALSSNANFGPVDALVSKKMGDCICGNVLHALQSFAHFLQGITEVFITLDLAMTKYIETCPQPTPSSPEKCGCPQKKIFEEWETILYPPETSKALTLLYLSNAFQELQFGIASCVVHNQSCPCSVTSNYSSLTPIINIITSLTPTLLKPFVDGIAQIESDPTDFCYVDVTTLLSDISGDLANINTTIANLPTTLTHTPYWLDAYKIISKATNSFNDFYTKTITAVSLYFSPNHCNKSDDSISPTIVGTNDCPVQDAFKTLEGLDTLFESALKSGDSCVVGVMKIPTHPAHPEYPNILVPPCLCNTDLYPPVDKSIVSDYDTFAAGWGSISTKLASALETISDNKYAALTGLYADLIPVLEEAKKFAALLNGSTESDGSFAFFKQYVRWHFQDVILSNLTYILENIAPLHVNIHLVRNSISNAVYGYNSRCSPSIDDNPPPPANDNCALYTQIFQKWREMAYPSQAGTVAAVADLEKAAITILYGIPASLGMFKEVNDCPIGMMCIAKALYGKLDDDISNLKTKAAANLQPIIDGVNIIINDPTSFDRPDVVVYIPDLETSAKAITASIDKINSTLNDQSYYVDVFNSLSTMPEEFRALAQSFQKVVDVYFSKCTKPPTKKDELDI